MYLFIHCLHVPTVFQELKIFESLSLLAFRPTPEPNKTIMCLPWIDLFMAACVSP